MSNTWRDDALLRGKLRMQARSRATFDVTLTLGARVLYFALDDLGMADGITSDLKQFTLAALLGCSVRSLAEWAKELEGKYIEQKRGQRGCRFQLLWAKSRSAEKCVSGETRSAEKYRSDLQKSADQDLQSIPRPYSYKHSMFSNGRTEAEGANEAVNVVRSWLIEYPDSGGLRGEPDDVIVQQCIEIAAGNLRDLRDAISEIYKLNHGRNKPTRSWAWFPSVLRKMADTNQAATA